ncbi:MAG: PTS IIA-like nitrogen regulatory protein PtsN [Gammaproteobacteria bacterium]|nr:PTS IIA-like nitrogen regulatory protein PtsN [Gammaproteobacteria bacterium]
MQIADCILPERIVCGASTGSKKRGLELLSGLLSEGEEQLSSVVVFESLLARERLGGTGVGHGVAIPHGRMKNIDHAVGAFLQLEKGVDFDAIDNRPVDLLFALIVPEQSTGEHLKLLAQLAQMFSDEKLRDALRQAQSCSEIHQLLTQWNPPPSQGNTASQG